MQASVRGHFFGKGFRKAGYEDEELIFQSSYSESPRELQFLEFCRDLGSEH